MTPRKLKHLGTALLIALLLCTLTACSLLGGGSVGYEDTLVFSRMSKKILRTIA